ncbi:hypothetical protein CSA37_09395 [Candidatus Fermentibacteria bacterium]|nr:MAG: hypothetical protein CSA37_09395 [Candidatus Fermentibacteria bacterium]
MLLILYRKTAPVTSRGSGMDTLNSPTEKTLIPWIQTAWNRITMDYRESESVVPDDETALAATSSHTG